MENLQQTELTVIAKDFGLEETKAVEINNSFAPKLIERDGYYEVYKNILTQEITQELCDQANDLRKKLVKVRTGIADIHKTEKAFFLASGKYVDALKNKYTLPVEQMESKLEEVINHFANLEKARLTEIRLEREAKLAPFGYEIGNVDFSGMDENMFTAVLLGVEKKYNDKIEAEKQAELARLEALKIEAEEKEKQRLEFERLKAENDAKEKQIQAERLEANRIALELKAKADAELAEANRLAKIEADKQKAINDKLQAELKAKADAELKAKEQLIIEQRAKELAEKKAQKAPDKDKMLVWVNSLELLSIELKNNDANDIAKEVKSKFEGFKKWALSQINTL